MKTFKFKSKVITINEDGDRLEVEVDGKQLPVWKTETGYGVFYNGAHKSALAAVKAFLKTQS